MGKTPAPLDSPDRDRQLFAMDLVKDPALSAGAEVSEEEISALVRRAQTGDTEAFAQLIARLEGKLRRQALFLTGHDHQALDLLQETLLEAWRHLARYDGRSRFFTWVCSIMAHRHYDWVRRWRTRALTLFAAQPDENWPENAPSPHEALSVRDDARIMRLCVDQLPARQRMVVYLRFYVGESLEGISAILQCSVGTVKSRLFHALRRLAKMEEMKQLHHNLNPT
jgi:RNA polymerase sigma-70 factor (ECF subfamily)